MCILMFSISNLHMFMNTFLRFLKIVRFLRKISGALALGWLCYRGSINCENAHFTHVYDTFIAYRLWSHFGAKKKSNTKTNLLKILTRGIPVKIIYLFYIFFIYISLQYTTQSNLTLTIFTYDYYEYWTSIC